MFCDNKKCTDDKRTKLKFVNAINCSISDTFDGVLGLAPGSSEGSENLV